MYFGKLFQLLYGNRRALSAAAGDDPAAEHTRLGVDGDVEGSRNPAGGSAARDRYDVRQVGSAAVEDAQDKICPTNKVYDPDSDSQSVYNQLYPLYRDLYFALGEPGKNPLASVLPELIRVSESVLKDRVFAKA